MPSSEFLKDLDRPAIAVERHFDEVTVVDRSPYTYEIIDEALRDLTNKINLYSLERHPDFKFYCVKLFANSPWKVSQGVITLSDLILSLSGYKVSSDTAIVLLKVEKDKQKAESVMTNSSEDFEKLKKESLQELEKISGKIYAIETFIIRQEKVNEDVKNLKDLLDGHILLRATRNISLKTIIGFVIAILALSDFSSSLLTDFLQNTNFINKHQVETIQR